MADGNPVIEMELHARPSMTMNLEPASSAVRQLIDDTAGAGVTDKTWSADKLIESMSSLSAEISGIGVATLISGNKYRLAL